MPENIFSPLIRGRVSNWRRVGNSAANYFQSIDRSSLGLVKTTEGVVNAASNFAGTAGGVAGGIALGMSQAAAAGVAGAGFLAAVAGPQVAVTAGVVGLAMLVKGTYSNREAAHVALIDYVWNLVDDQPPAKGVRWTQEDLEKACDAAATLLDDGKNQMKLLGSKLDSARRKFEGVQLKLVEIFNAVEAQKALLLDPRAATVERARMAIKALRERAEALWTQECKPGGAIFDYVRRLSHAGNYLQAPHLIGLGMKNMVLGGEVLREEQPDFFKGSEWAANSRKSFQALSDWYKLVRGA